jgi:RNA polymerase sigma factor (sigma-70 family)
MPQDLQDDQTLLDRVRAGDRAAEHALYATYAECALRRARRFGVQHADAEDLVAEAFLRVFHHVRRGLGPRRVLVPYLFAALRNLAVDARRGPRGRETPTAAIGVAIDRASAGPDPQEELALRMSLQAAMHRLPERWRRLLWQVHVEGRTTASVAAELGASPQAVSAMAYRARKALRSAYRLVEASYP